MIRTPLLKRGSISVSDFRCTAGPGDKPFVEQFDCHSVSYVRKGSFGCQSRGDGRSNWWRDRSWSAIPATNMSAATITVCGDECLSFFLAPELVEAIGDRTEAWRVGAAPPLPELMVLGELAQAAADGRSDIGLDEIGHLFASRFVEVVSGAGAKAGADGGPRSPPRGRNRALDRREFAPTDRSGRRRRPGRNQPVPLPAAVFQRARRHPAPISGALAAAPCGAPAWPTMTAPITDIAYDVGFGDLSNFVRTFHRAAGVSPRHFREASRGDRKILQERLALH